MKRLLCALAAFLLVLSLASCGNGEQGTETDGGTSTEPAETQEQPGNSIFHSEFSTLEDYIAFARENGEKDVVLYIPANLPAAFTLRRLVFDIKDGMTMEYGDGHQTVTFRKFVCDAPASVFDLSYPVPDYTVTQVGSREYRYRTVQEERADGFYFGYSVAFLLNGSLYTAEIPAIGSLEQVLSMAVLSQMIAFE